MKKLLQSVLFLLLPFQGFAQLSVTPENSIVTAVETENECLSDSVKLKYYSRYKIERDSICYVNLYCEVYEWLGVKYAYGKGTKKGTDCSHFVSNVTRSSMGYKIDGSAASIYECCEEVKKHELQEGDLVFFRINKKHISHVGVYLQNGKFAHATVHGGVMISDLDESYYKKYFVGGGKPK